MSSNEPSSSSTETSLKFTEKGKKKLPKKTTKFSTFSDEQEIQTQKSIEEQHQLWQEQRVCSIKHISKAIWNHELRMANIYVAKRNVLKTMGRTYDKKIYLSPEETLFLVDEGILDLRVDLNGDSLSLQEAFNLTLTNQLSLEQYQVYSYLKKLGFVVCPHLLGFSEISIQKNQENRKKDEKEIRIDYDVYQNSPNFSKTKLPKPLFHVIVSKFDEGFPGPISSPDDIELKVAVVHLGEVLFYNLLSPSLVIESVHGCGNSHLN